MQGTPFVTVFDTLDELENNMLKVLEDNSQRYYYWQIVGQLEMMIRNYDFSFFNLDPEWSVDPDFRIWERSRHDYSRYVEVAITPEERGMLVNCHNQLKELALYYKQLSFDKVLPEKGADGKYHPDTLGRLYRLINSTQIKISEIDTSKIDNMDFLFAYDWRTDFNGIEDWDVSHVTNMFGMFRGTSFKNEPDLSGWDVSHVTNMAQMFQFCRINCNISNWNVSNVERMDAMFAGSTFHGDLSRWDLKSLKNSDNMFSLADAQYELKDNHLILKDYRHHDEEADDEEEVVSDMNFELA